MPTTVRVLLVDHLDFPVDQIDVPMDDRGRTPFTVVHGGWVYMRLSVKALTYKRDPTCYFSPATPDGSFKVLRGNGD